MATNNLAVRKGRCINIGNCKKADTREVLEINLGDEFFCTECGGTLVEVKEKPFPKWIIYLIIAILVIGIGTAFWVKQCSDTPKPTNHGSIHIDQELEPSNPILTEKEDATSSESNGDQQLQPNVINIEQLNNQLIAALINMADNDGDKLSRIQMVEPTLNKYFSLTSSTVEIYNQNGRTMLRRENALDFLERVSTSFNLINFSIMPESQTDENGKYTFLKIKEIYK